MFDAPLALKTRTTCPYCGVGCGVEVSGVEAIGDAGHPANFGRLCSKGSALGETLGSENRLLHPLINNRRVSWDEALDLAARKFAGAIAKHGPDSVAFYMSGQFLTEDYYVANKLMKGFFGAANIDTNSRLCMASSVAGHVRAFGEDVVPGCYEDIDEADLVVLVGSNMAWCHPVLYRRLVAARERRKTKIIVIDPRRTASCDEADLHLPLKLGSDVALFNGLLAHLAAGPACDNDYVAAHTNGFDAALVAARAASIESIADITGLDIAAIRAFYTMFERIPRAVTLYSQGVNQSSAGTDKVNSIINCHLVTGRIGKAGMGPFSLTGQPNAMGGREVGGLANQLAAHMNLANPAHVDRVSRFWNAENMATKPGLKAVDMFDAMHDGKIRAIWIAGTNPAVSLPRSDRIREALKACPFVVVADVGDNDTTAFAHVKLPAMGWSEKDGTATNSERRISRQRAFRRAPGEARADWWMLSQLARRMGFAKAFSYENSAQIFREHAALSAFENDDERAFNIGGLATLSDAGYDALEPVQWPVRVAGAGIQRLYADARFSHPDQRARFIATPFRGTMEAPDAARTLMLNTGRVRDQWHTMTRTGDVPRLAQHTPEPFLDVHPQDAARAKIRDGGFARVESRHGATIMRVRTSDAQRKGEVFAAMHWSEINSSTGPADRLVGAACDPVSCQPELKATAIMLLPQAMTWHGLLLERDPRALKAPDYWCRIAIDGGFMYTLAGAQPLISPGDLPTRGRLLEWLGEFTPDNLAVYADPARGVFRYARFDNGLLAACLFLAREESSLPDRAAAAAMFAEAAPQTNRARALAGRPLSGAPGVGAIICACFAVGRTTICDAIAAQSLNSVEAIGKVVKAGTNCGSCKPELAVILRETLASPPLAIAAQ